MSSAASATAAEGVLYEVAYDEAVRALVEQLSLIDSFRTRAGLLFSAAAIATSLLGGPADHLGWASWIALGFFFAVAALTLAILWPRPRESSADPERVIKGFIEAGKPRTTAELHRALTLQMQGSYVRTWKDIGQLAILFQVASGALVLEIVFWILALID
jgi:hypothetical protein